ncbi:MAG: hypothetical protein IPP32_08740 [Bacteroidetes bacterium]|nr:hypothetical protein [Bacteroidota bacterium]
MRKVIILFLFFLILMFIRALIPYYIEEFILVKRIKSELIKFDFSPVGSTTFNRK